MSLGELPKNKSLRSAENLILYESTLDFWQILFTYFFSKVLIFIVIFSGMPERFSLCLSLTEGTN